MPDDYGDVLITRGTGGEKESKNVVENKPLNLPIVVQQRELLTAFIDWCEKEEQCDLTKFGLIDGWFNKSD